MRTLDCLTLCPFVLHFTLFIRHCQVLFAFLSVQNYQIFSRYSWERVRACVRERSPSGSPLTPKGERGLSVIRRRAAVKQSKGEPLHCITQASDDIYGRQGALFIRFATLHGIKCAFTLTTFQEYGIKVFRPYQDRFYPVQEL